MLGFVPGLLHSWYIIAKFPEYDEYDSLPQDAEAGRVTYVVVTSPNGGRTRVPNHVVRPGPQSYGTTAPMAPPVHQDQNGTWNNNGAPGVPGAEGSSGGVPPSYAEAVKGDNKVQTNH